MYIQASRLLKNYSCWILTLLEKSGPRPRGRVETRGPVSAPPADVAARGEEQKKQQIKTGFKGAVSAVPTWAWITLGTLTAAGGGYFVYRRFYKK